VVVKWKGACQLHYVPGLLFYGVKNASHGRAWHRVPSGRIQNRRWSFRGECERDWVIPERVIPRFVQALLLSCLSPRGARGY